MIESAQKSQFSNQNHTSLSALKFELKNLLKSKAEFSIHRTNTTLKVKVQVGSLLN